MAMRDTLLPSQQVELESKILSALERSDDISKRAVNELIESIKKEPISEQVKKMTLLYEFINWQKELMDFLIQYRVIKETSFISDFPPSSVGPYFDAFLDVLEVHYMAVIICGIAAIGAGVCLYLMSAGFATLFMAIGVSCIVASIWGSLAPSDKKYNDAYADFSKVLYDSRETKSDDGRKHYDYDGWLSYEKNFFPNTSPYTMGSALRSLQPEDPGSLKKDSSRIKYHFSADFKEKDDIHTKAQFLTLAYQIRTIETNLKNFSKEVRLCFYQVISSHQAENKNIPNVEIEITALKNKFSTKANELKKNWAPFFRGLTTSKIKKAEEMINIEELKAMRMYARNREG